MKSCIVVSFMWSHEKFNILRKLLKSRVNQRDTY